MRLPSDAPLAYPRSKIGSDYLRSAVGAGICLAPVIFGAPLAGGVWVLVVLAAVFILFAVRTAIRQRMRFWVSDEGIAVSGFVRRLLPWEKLTDVTLSYYSTMQGRGKGWMQLRLKGNGHTLRIESSLDGFDGISRRAAAAARDNGIALGPTTLRNFEAMGIEF